MKLSLPSFYSSSLLIAINSHTTKRLAYTALVLGLLVVTSCTTAYKPKTDSVFSSTGYSHTQLSRDTFDVYFVARDREEERARDFVLLRTAELCLSHQFSHFTILEQSRSHQGHGGGVAPIISVGGRHGGVGSVISTSGGSDRNNVRNRIRCYNGSQSVSGTEYEASYVRSSVSEKYNIS